MGRFTNAVKWININLSKNSLSDYADMIFEILKEVEAEFKGLK